MKRLFILLFSLLLCVVSYADTETINWYVDGNSYATTTCQTGGDIILPNTPYKYGYTFQGWNGYTQIEYLEISENQYIDTGVVPSYTSTKIKADIFPLNSGNCFGCGSGAESNRFFLQIQNNSSDFAIGLTSNFYATNIVSSRKTVVFEPNGINLYKVSIGSAEYTYDISQAGLPKDSIKIPIKGRIYYFQIYYNNSLVHDFIPVIDAHGIPCMYDKVTHQYFYNQGTGNFIAGPVINQ